MAPIIRLSRATGWALRRKARPAGTKIEKTTEHEMRPPNAIDFWRGVALVMIFVNHIPGVGYSVLTLRQFAISDAAELFVFLAGCSLAFVVNGRSEPRPLGEVVMRLLIRTFEIWRAQIVTISIALAMLGGSAIAFTDPLFLEWHGAGPAFSDTVRASIGMVLLSYQIGYFNILPLYVVLLPVATVFLLAARWSKSAAMALSLLLYATALTTGLVPPSWPSQDQWFFNPLSWQLLLVSGFVMAEMSRESDRLEKLAKRLMPLAILLVMVGASLVLARWHPDPLRVPQPRLLFIFDKHFLSPARVVSLLALVVAFHAVFPVLARWLGPVSDYMCKLGRNSLPVFCVGSLLSLVGQIVRFVAGGNFAIDTAIIIGGIVVMGFTAWFSEWREASSPKSQPGS